MSENFYDEIEFEDLEYDEKNELYYYPCPCGDRFQIALDDMYDGWDVGVCPSCSLQIKVIFDDDDLPKRDPSGQPIPVAA